MKNRPLPNPAPDPILARSNDSLADGLDDFAAITPPGPCQLVMREAAKRLRTAAYVPGRGIRSVEGSVQ